MFSTWDLVRPTLWHPMSMLEQSMMDLDMLTSQMGRSRFPLTQSMFASPSLDEDDEFFKDLPVKERGEEPSVKQPEKEKQPEPEDTRAFSSYSFSNSSVVDDKGRRIVSTRRRYEDSNGRLKAVHEREVDGRRMKTIWNRQNKNDEGALRTICSSGNADEFERIWSQTPFGLAQEKKQKEIKESGEAEASTGSKGSHCAKCGSSACSCKGSKGDQCAKCGSSASSCPSKSTGQGGKSTTTQAPEPMEM